MNYADIVRPEEMQATRDWVEQTLNLLTGPRRKGSQVEVQCVSQSYGTFTRGRSVIGTPLCLSGREHEAGFGTHADSEVVLRLSRPGARLTGLAGADDNWDTRANGSAKMIFIVAVGGRDVWKTGRLDNKSEPVRFDIDLKGAKEVRLRVTAPEGIACAHADWADPHVTFDDGSTELLGERLSAVSGPCFSFTYDGHPSGDLLKEWGLEQKPPVEGDGIRWRQLTWTDPKTSRVCAMELKEYLDFPVGEWVLRFKNTGIKPTPVLEDIRSMALELDAAQDAFLHYHDGDYQAPDSYQPHRAKMEDGWCFRFAPEGGRPTNKTFPYFNVEYPQQKCGAILVIGWPGQWSARFDFGDARRRVVAGQELTHFCLQPGEEVRTPLSVVMLWQGDRVRSQNLWRRWMFAHNLPRPGGKLPEPMFHVCMGLQQSEKREKAFIDAYFRRGIRFTHWWMDAGWYPAKDNSWPGVGTWKPDPERFPHGIRAVSDHAHRKRMKLILWFEPERVTPGTELDVDHPEMLLKGATSSDNKLLNLGNPGAWKWIVERIDSLLVSEGIDVYRQDHNFNPLTYWRDNDAPDRQGITETRYVEGYLALWDELRRRHPDLLIDSCASGGRRNDLETLRRGVPLLRSDYTHAQNPTGDPNEYATGNQGHSYGLSSWIPFAGTGVFADNTYVARSYFTPSMGMALAGPGYRLADPGNDEADWKQFKLMHAQWRRISPFFYGDYYPLTPYSLDEEAWVAWQFHRPDLDAGMAQFFRHSRSPFISARFRLLALDPDATYAVTDMDKPRRRTEAAGKDLMETGFKVEMRECPDSVLIVYEKCP